MYNTEHKQVSDKTNQSVVKQMSQWQIKKTKAKTKVKEKSERKKWRQKTTINTEGNDQMKEEKRWKSVHQQNPPVTETTTKTVWKIWEKKQNFV